MIDTDRMHIIPLTAQQFRYWIEDISALEKVLNCSYQAEPLEGVFLDILKNQLEITENDESNYLYHTFWFLITKTSRIVVGSADFKGTPSKSGEVEIGYGLGKAFEHNGYMTEAIKAMCEWALIQNDISHIVAETNADSQASHNILKRCGFSLYKQGDTYWWRL